MSLKIYFDSLTSSPIYEYLIIVQCENRDQPD